MPEPRLLEGVVEAEDPRAGQIARLEAEIRSLKRERDDAIVEAERAREDATRALAALRRQLSPLYRALQAVFGELDAAGVEDVPVSAGAPQAAGAPRGIDPRVQQVWNEWKQKLGADSAAARIIDALLIHDALNVAQLKVAAKMATQTVYDATSKLNRLGLINKNGGKYSLKSL